MPPLDRALALKQRDHIAVLIGQHLELDVPRLLNELLHVELAVAECVRRLGKRRMKQIGQILGVAHNPHAAPAAAGLGLQDDRIANLSGPLARLFGRRQNPVRSRQNRHLGLLHCLARFFFFAHQPRHFRRRPNELDIRRAAHFGEVRVLAQQSVSGMDRLHIGNLRRRNHRRHIQIAVRRARRPNADRLIGKAHMQRVAIGLAVHGNRANAQLPARVQHAQRDFASIGNQYLTKHE